MELVRKLKEVGLSIVPILVLVLILQLLVLDLAPQVLGAFLSGGVLIIIGLSFFLLGIDIGLLPVGERIGSTVTRKKHLSWLLLTGFLVGVVIIFAEPSIAVLKGQVAAVNPTINTTQMQFFIAVGVGIYLMFGILRVVFHLSLKWIYAISYLVLFALAAASSPDLVALAFDSGGAATGPLAVPFIMALGVGIARVQKVQKDSDNFGYVSLALIGPTFALLSQGLFSPSSGSSAIAEVVVPQAGAFLPALYSAVVQVAQSLLPLLLLILLYQFLLLHMPFGQLIRIGVGFFYLFVGLTLFFVGVNIGFVPAGFQIGYQLGLLSNPLLLLIGFAVGAITVLSEPSVWVLVDQVQEITQGHLKKPVMLAALAIGVGFSLFFAMVRIVTGLSIWYFILPAYALAVILTFVIPDLFIGLAFDSGSVSSGPLASTFILSFAIGASVAMGGNPATDAFGVIIFVSMTPVLTVELLGLLYKRAQTRLAAKKGVRT